MIQYKISYVLFDKKEPIKVCFNLDDTMKYIELHSDVEFVETMVIHEKLPVNDFIKQRSGLCMSTYI